MHNLNIIHRDIKPENIYIDEEGFLKFHDLGTAKKIQDRAYTLIGTPLYIAPEIFLSTGYDFAADYWSLGVCMFEFLCGYAPFDVNSMDPLEIYKKIVSTDIIEFPEFLKDNEAKDLINRLLVKDPEKRLSNP